MTGTNNQEDDLENNQTAEDIINAKGNYQSYTATKDCHKHEPRINKETTKHSPMDSGQYGYVFSNCQSVSVYISQRLGVSGFLLGDYCFFIVSYFGLSGASLLNRELEMAVLYTQMMVRTNLTVGTCPKCYSKSVCTA